MGRCDLQLCACINAFVGLVCGDLLKSLTLFVTKAACGVAVVTGCQVLGATEQASPVLILISAVQVDGVRHGSNGAASGFC